ncbi:hypothetical protein [Haloferax profundi]|nr:hypothetical protein [Haloferax profundi]
MEVLLSAHATHLIQGLMAGMGIMIEGPSGCGKTTILRPLFGLDEQIYRSDDLTPASFVSADSSRTEEELAEIDLLPRLKGKTLVVPDMATWFNGPEEQIRERYGTFASVMDGDGFTRDSGSQGVRGYTGDYRFNFMGATTPISPRGHRVMSHVGNRLLFVTMTDETDDDKAFDSIFSGPEYGELVSRTREATHTYLRGLWKYHGGREAVNWESDPSDDAIDALRYLSRLIQYSRAPLREGSPQRESLRRVGTMLRNLARGHALLDGRTQVLMEDIDVCIRVALSTMPANRRGAVRALVHPETSSAVTTAEIADYGSMSRPTARKRMEELEDLGLGTVKQGKGKSICPDSDFVWPGNLNFPRRAAE